MRSPLIVTVLVQLLAIGRLLQRAVASGDRVDGCQEHGQQAESLPIESKWILGDPADGSATIGG